MIVLKLTLLEKLCLPIGRFTCFKYCQQYLTSLNMRINWGHVKAACSFLEV